MQTALRVSYTDNEQDPVYPEDTGGNFGDFLHHQRQPSDQLQFSEIYINHDTFDQDQPVTLFYDENFQRSITHVRAINLGRERAYVQCISLGSMTGEVKIDFIIKANEKVRLLVEIYTEM